MNGIIPRSFVNSVNNVVPDEEGNVTLNFPVTSVNGVTGAVTINTVYAYGESTSYIEAQSSDGYIRNCASWTTINGKRYRWIFYAKPSKLTTFEVSFYDESNKKWTASEVYTSNNPPPYPITSVNGETGAIYVSTLNQNNNAGVAGLRVDSDSDYSVWHSYNNKGTILGKFEFYGRDAINNVPKIYIIDPASTQFKVVLTNDRFNCSLSGTTLHINWANI